MRLCTLIQTLRCQLGGVFPVYYQTTAIQLLGQGGPDVVGPVELPQLLIAEAHGVDRIQIAPIQIQRLVPMVKGLIVAL